MPGKTAAGWLALAVAALIVDFEIYADDTSVQVAPYRATAALGPRP